MAHRPKARYPMRGHLTRAAIFDTTHIRTKTRDPDSNNRFQVCAAIFTVPDREFMNMVRSSARNILQAREIVDGAPEFRVGATIYRGLWIVDAYFMLEAAHYLGYSNVAEYGIRALLRRVQPSGGIEVVSANMPSHHLKETGVSLATLARQVELMGAPEKIVDYWDVVLHAVSYIASLHDKAKALPPDAAEFDLLPKTFGDGRLGGKRPE